MIKCVIHLADVHIRPYVRLGEYAEVLSSFVKKLKEITSTYERDEVRIVISGDLFESKNIERAYDIQQFLLKETRGNCQGLGIGW